jgi:hypothetical protein
MILYHITEKRNLKKILREGLKLGYDKKIYFSESILFAKTWIDILKEDYSLEKIPFKILKIKVDKFEITKQTPGENTIFEAVSYDSIEPASILEVIR